MTEFAPYSPSSVPEAMDVALREVLGYLNYSAGRFDPKFHRNLNLLFEAMGPDQAWDQLAAWLPQVLEHQQHTNPAFADCEQAKAVLSLVFGRLLPDYREFHRDLLFHLPVQRYHNPFLLGKFCEAILSQGGPWSEEGRILNGAIHQLNDFIGHRPVAVLENGREMQPYEHEKFRPLPLYLGEVGVAQGPYHALLEQALTHLRQTPQDILQGAHFHLEQVQELALDLRAYDHVHPMYKRTNYMFGEWDPVQIDNSGRYRRFVLRSIVLEALDDWMKHVSKKLPQDEVLYEAAAVLCGTILMASTISGAGPLTYDSTTNLGALLPKVARQRDEFYHRLLASLEGENAKRIKKESERTRQPFGHVRQHLNLYIANRGAKQVQHSHLAYLYARMGYPDASREQAAVIPALSVRFEGEIECRLASGHLAIDRVDLANAAQIVRELEDLLQRGIHCGALIDPWNILGFQGNFPLFHTREDAVNDPRVERLLELVEQIFAYYSRVLSEGAAEGALELRQEVSGIFRHLAEQWDRYATSAVSGITEVRGMESWTSASEVEKALAEWCDAGEAAGDISFWRERVQNFESVKAYALTLEVLLRKKDRVAAMGLLMQWLSQAETVGLESGPFSFHGQIHEWLRIVTARPSFVPDQESFWIKDWPVVVKLFDYLEANAGDYWDVPSLDSFRAETLKAQPEGDDEDDSRETDLYQAAYEDVTYRDSSRDGVDSNTADGATGPSFDSDFDQLQEFLEPRLRFLATVAHLWQQSATRFLLERHSASSTQKSLEPSDSVSILRRWYERIDAVQHSLEELSRQLVAMKIPAPGGDPDSLGEYDRQSQVKFYLLNQLIGTQLAHQEAAWQLLSGIAPGEFPPSLQDWERLALEIYQAMLSEDLPAVRQRFPSLITALQDKPLLYVPLDHGGDPQHLLLTRRLQSCIHLLLMQLPRVGMFRETWHLLKTVQRMEQESPRGGTVITEFDRLFTTGLKCSLECLIQMSNHWDKGGLPPDDLIELIGEITDHYLDLWLEHSSTMRLSSVEALSHEQTWKDVVKFIEKFGGDFFHAQMLTFGNIRAILHNGVQRFLDYLAENQDPLHPIVLLESGTDQEKKDAVALLELIFQITIEKYDRFLEYNTTTTQSDYGEQFDKFLDFLRLEASYERQAWNLSPLVIAHQVLSRNGRLPESEIWRDVFQSRTEFSAEEHLKRLKKLETKYGMKLPGIRDLLEERFIKPLQLDRILSLVPKAMLEARKSQPDQVTFPMLRQQIREYGESTSGAGVDIPPWLRALENEVEHSESSPAGEHELEDEFVLPVKLLPISHDALLTQLKDWAKKTRDPKKRKEK
ncbi:MAG: hypothetical protein U0903_07050 [Planctomycetales bacterium]